MITRDPRDAFPSTKPSKSRQAQLRRAVDKAGKAWQRAQRLVVIAEAKQSKIANGGRLTPAKERRLVSLQSEIELLRGRRASAYTDYSKALRAEYDE